MELSTYIDNLHGKLFHLRHGKDTCRRFPYAFENVVNPLALVYGCACYARQNPFGFFCVGAQLRVVYARAVVYSAVVILHCTSIKLFKNAFYLLPVPYVINLYGFLTLPLLAVLVVRLVLVARQRCPVHDHIRIAHIVQDIFDREVESLYRSCDYCPDAVVLVSTFVGRIRFISVRKVVSPKKSPNSIF